MMNTAANAINNSVVTKNIRMQAVAGKKMENFKEGLQKFWKAFTDTEIENSYGLSPDMQAKLYL